MSNHFVWKLSCRFAWMVGIRSVRIEFFSWPDLLVFIRVVVGLSVCLIGWYSVELVLSCQFVWWLGGRFI